MPEFELVRQDDRCGINDVKNGLDVNADRRCVVEMSYEANGSTFVAERHRDTAPCLCLGFQGWWQGVGEESRKGDGKHYVSEVGQGD